MYFEIENTPEHIRKARRSQAVQKPTPKEECPRLILAPFTKPPQVVFDNVLIGTTCEKNIEVFNPSKQPQQITLSKTLPPGLVIQLPGEGLELEPESSYCVSLLWSPVQPTALRETIQFTNTSRGRYDIIVVLKTFNNAKVKPKGFKVSPGKIKKNTTKKSPVAIKRKKSEIIYNTTQIKKSVNYIQQSVHHRILQPSNKDIFSEINNYSIDSRTDNCPFGSPNSNITFDNSKVFSNFKQSRTDQTYEKSYSVRASTKPLDISGMDVFDNLTFTPLKTIPDKNVKSEVAIVLTMNSDSEFDDSLDNKENETHPIIHVGSTQAPNKWLTANHQPKEIVETAQNKKIPNTSSPKELSSPNFSINTEFSRISDLSFCPSRFSTEKKKFSVVNNETHEIYDQYNADTFTKDSPYIVKETLQFHFNDVHPAHYFMKDQNPKMCRQSLFREYQHQRDIFDRNPMGTQKYDHNVWQNDLRADIHTPPRSITPPLQSIPEESTQASETQILDKTDKPTATFTINRTFNKPNETISNATNNRQSWSKKAFRAEPELWKVPIFQPRKSLKPKERSESIGSKISSTTSEANKTMEQCMSMSYIGNVYSQSLTVDPFLSTTYYFDEAAVDKFEKEFKRWLNCILTPPADLDSNVEQKIDVGKVWIENRNKEVPLAPTKEQVSSNYHNSHRLESLRRAARALLMSPEIAQVFQKLNVQIEKKLIAVRIDRNLHLDIGLQKVIMELLLSYNPLWLRIGLEAIYGLVLPLRSNNDIEGLTTFILKRMFKNPHLKNKHSKSSAPNMLLPAYMEAIKKFTLKKFFMLIFFLDQAKQKKLISHDPCLFCRNAICKESREILIRFTRELIAGIGDITKHLRPLGYVVYHKQSYLDEYKYAVNNLAVDLRDGVRLTKVMEIILIKNGLLNQLRTPAISRLQKIHNVSVAFKALKEANFNIGGDITPTDIADGHREKTLSLLWQLIHVLRAPLFEKAANVIQIWWRKKYDVILEKRREEEKIKRKLNNAASVIQCWWRRKQYDRLVERQMTRITTATTVVQKYCRMWLCRTRLRKLKRSALKIEEWYKSIKQMREAYSTFQRLKAEKEELRRKSAVVIQSYIRKWLCVREYKLKIKKVVLIQSVVRCYIIRKQFVQMKKAAQFIQQKYKGKLQMRRDMKNFSEKRASAIVIQSYFRMIIQYRMFQKLKQAVRTLEEKYLALINMRMKRKKYLNLKESVIKIQAQIRCKLTRKTFMQQKTAVIKIQRRYRANQLMKQEKASYLHLKNATIVIQNRFKAHLSMKKARNDYLNLKEAVIKTQRRFRANKHAKSQKDCYMKIRDSVVLVQRRYRALLTMRKERCAYLRLQKSVKFIQTRWRFLKQYKQKIQKIVCVQSNIRRFLARNRFIQIRKAVLYVQKMYRGKLQMRKDLKNFTEKRNCAIVIQSYYRMIKTYRFFKNLKRSVHCFEEYYIALIKMKADRIKYLKLKESAIKIQALYRCKSTRSQFLKLKTVSVNVQRRFRANQIMKQEKENYKCLKNATITLQRRFKAYLLMKQSKENFNTLKNAASVIQNRFRANKIAKIQRSSYLKLRNSTILIQTQYRSLLVMRKDRAHYLILKKSVLTIETQWLRLKEYRLKIKRITLIQSLVRRYLVQKQFRQLKKTISFVQEKYRGKLQMRKDIKNLTEKRKCAILIQSYFRMIVQYRTFQKLKQTVITIENRYIALNKMRIEREKYFALKECVIKLQALCRCRALRQKFLKQKKAAIVIQRRFRANQSMKTERADFLQLRNAAIAIQNRFRAQKAMKQVRQDYVKLRNAVITIQTRYRSNKKAQSQRHYYNKLRNSVVFTQRHFRAIMCMRKESMEYMKLKQSVVVIQRWFRAQRNGKQCRESYLRIRTSAILIQRQYRSYKLMCEERAKYLRLKSSCIIIQRYLRAYTLAKYERTSFLKKKWATTLIQKWYRSCLERKNCQREYLATKKYIVKLQAVIRGYLVRKEVESKKENIMKVREDKKQNRAASLIQALFRGQKARKNTASDKRVQEIRRRWREGALKSTQETLKERNEKAIEVIRKMSDIESVIDAFRTIEFHTEVYPNIYSDIASSLVRRVYTYMSVTNRSISSIDLLKSAASLLVNLVRYKVTGPKIYERERISASLKYMWRFSNSETQLFCIFSTYIWLFSKYDEIREDLTEFLHIPEYHKMLVTIKNNIDRMKRMERNKYHTPQSTKYVSNQSWCSSASTVAPLPALEPDYGIIRPDKPRYFDDARQAITCLFSTYNL